MKPSTITVRVMCGRFQAAKEAAIRGIPFGFIQESTNGAWTLGKVARDYLPELNHWFAEGKEPRAHPVNP